MAGPVGGPPESLAGPTALNDTEPPIEFKVLDMYLKFWDQCNRKSDDEMTALENLNTEMKKFNDLLAPLGAFDSMIGGTRDNAELIKAIDKKPELMYEINAAMKAAGLSLFPKTEPNRSGFVYEHFGMTHPPRTTPLPEAKTPIELLPYLSTRAVKVTMTAGAPEWKPKHREAAQAFLGKLPDDPSQVTGGQWDTLSSHLSAALTPVHAPTEQVTLNDYPEMQDGSGKTGVRLGSVDSKISVPIHPEEISIRDLRDVCVEIGNAYVNGFNSEMDLRVMGGLNKSFAGPDVISAFQTVKSKISDLSNQLQAKSIDVNSAMQKASAALNAVVELINRLFSSLSKLLA